MSSTRCISHKIHTFTPERVNYAVKNTLWEAQYIRRGNMYTLYIII